MVYCGTSNIVLPVRNKTAFPESFRDRSHLEYYASLFNSVEINSTFYKLPLPATTAKWASLVPVDFRFTVKISKTITHQKELVFNPADVSKFFETVKGFGHKKGCLLIQLPAGAKADLVERFEDLLDHITQHNDGWQLAVEFRDKSWYYDRMYRLLEAAGCCLVEHDMPKSKPSTFPQSPVKYFRLHGERGDYRGSYTPEFIERLSEKIKDAEKDGHTVYTYFNNTIGDAVHNALALKKLSDPVLPTN